MDIWKTVKQANGEWGTPINLGPKINTAGTEQSPFIHADSRTLYYTSDGLPGMGEEDFFMSRMDENGEWQKAVNLGYPINSTGSERSLIINASGNKGYYASDKLKGIGQMDIYAFDVAEQIRPIRVAYVKGKVVNADNNQPVESRFELIDLANAKVVAEAYSDKVNGEFLICLPAEKNYALNVSKQGFLFYSENFSLKDNPQVKEALKMDIALKPIKLGQTMVLKNIFFNTNSYELKDESKAELEKLISFLNTNPKVKIEIGGHTDNVGDDKSNQVLSEKRALAVTEYLVAHGINKDKLTYKGYGESKPVASNETEEGRAQNRRTAFTIIAQ